MSLDDVRWTWACQEQGCLFRTETEPRAASAPPCPQHGIGFVARVCEVCGIQIPGARADAETCGGPCRAERSRRRRASANGTQAHRGAQAKRAAPRRRSPERGTRLYLLPSELAALERGVGQLGWLASRAVRARRELTRAARAKGDLERQTAAKVRAARRRLGRRSG